MNATNVDYYIVGFKSDGSRAAGKICMFDPIKHQDKLEAEAEKKQAAIATIKAKYQPTLDSLVDARVKAAMLGADTAKIDSQYKTTLASMATEIKNA